MDLEDQPDETACLSCRTFAFRTTAHGLKRIAGARGIYRKLTWALIVCIAVSGFTYHSIYLIMEYLQFPRITTTEEVHANVLEFPAVTVCNLNPLKKSFFNEYLNDSVASTQTGSNDEFDSKDYDSSEEDAICYRSIDEFLRRNRMVDLSDMWMSLIATKDNLKKYGHQAEDIIAQCTYNLRNCFNPIRSQPLIDITDFPSPRFGLCHTIIVSSNQNNFRYVTKPGSPFGLRLTLNIERQQYLDILTADYGARLVVHQPGTFPTVQEGGVVLQPGTKTYVGARMRKNQRLPKPYRGCDETIENSETGKKYKRFGSTFLNQFKVYTYEYCEALCKESRLLEKCGCLEELSREGDESCDPCNQTQVTCRGELYKKFASATTLTSCQKMCLPACHDIRYDLTVSQAEWPNPNHQKFVLKRRPVMNERFRKMLNITDQDVQNNNITINLPYMKENFLRVIVFLQDKNYLSITDQPAISLPQLFANLGGVLGLYIGVSSITIVEILEQLIIIISYVYHKPGDTADSVGHLLFGNTKRRFKKRGVAINFNRQPNVFLINEERASIFSFLNPKGRRNRNRQERNNLTLSRPIYNNRPAVLQLPGYNDGEETQYWENPPYPPSYDGYYNV